MTSDFFRKNREALIEKTKGSVVILTAYGQMQRTGDSAFPFVQESNFWYLTGINEPDWWLIIDGGRQKVWLVKPSLTEYQALFDGGLSNEGASAISGISEIVDREEAGSLLRQLARTHSLVRTVDQPEYVKHFGFFSNPAQRELRMYLERIFSSLQDCRKELAQLRAVKQPEEIAAIKKAIKISTHAYKVIYEKLQSYKYEYEIEADVSYIFALAKAGHAYGPIVASSANACTLHYAKNKAKLASGSFVLVDVGAKYENYAADITRTYAFGKIPARKQHVHQAVEVVQKRVIEMLQPGLSLEELQHKTETYIGEALVELGLTKSKTDTQAVHRYFPHAISHGLGVDVHDSFGFETLQPGMVLTVEPGLYVPQEKLGVRIEDDILITEKGAVNLSKGLSTHY